MERKLRLLSELGRRFDEAGCLWAVGASVLLYFKGYVDTFHDIDVMVNEADAEKMEAVLLDMGVLQPSEAGTFRTKYFREFVIDGIEVDMIGGFVIVQDGVAYDCDLQAEEIEGYAQVYGQRIPLHSVSKWREYYGRMGRSEKVAIIDEALGREPLVHAMKLQAEPFAKIRAGQKTVEMRLYDEKRQQIRVGDYITFQCGEETLTVRVCVLHRFPSFADLYGALPKKMLGYGEGEGADPKDMEQYYDPAQQRQYGVLGIEIERITI